MSLQVDVDHRIPVLFTQVDQHAVAQDPGVVHQHVQRAVGLQRALHESLATLPVGDVVVIGHGFATHGRDLGHHLFGRRGGVTRAVQRAAKVVHHDLGALVGEEQRVLSPDAATGSGDDCYATVQRTHGDPFEE